MVSYVNMSLMTLGEKNLWQACIRQHIQDLFLPETNTKNRKLKKDAYEFLFTNNSTYNVICCYAGYNPNRLRINIQRLYQEKMIKKESLIRKVFKNYAA